MSYEKKEYGYRIEGSQTKWVGSGKVGKADRDRIVKQLEQNANVTVTSVER
jgi:hypothetical protein